MTSEARKGRQIPENQEEVIGKVLENLQETIVFYNHAIERVANIMMLNTMLTSLKTLGEQIKALSSQKHIGSPMILHPSVSGESVIIFQLSQELFSVLDGSLRPDDEFQNIAGLRIKEVDAINLSEANIPYIVPRDLNKFGSNITVSLSDIDKFRLDEAQKLSQFVGGDKTAIDLVRQQMGGYQTDPIFPSDSK